MAKFFNIDGLTSKPIEKTARVKLIRTLLKGVARKLPGASKVEKVLVKGIDKAKKTKAGNAVQRTVNFVDNPKAFATTNKKSPMYIKSPIARKLVQRSGQVVGMPVRHPIMAAGGIMGWNAINENNKRKTYLKGAYNHSDTDSTDLKSVAANKYDNFYGSPNKDEINRVMGTNYSQGDVNRNMKIQQSLYPSVSTLGSKYTYKQFNPQTSAGWDFSVGDSLINNKGNTYQGLHDKADPKLTKRYYGQSIDSKESKNIYDTIKNSK